MIADLKQCIYDDKLSGSFLIAPIKYYHKLFDNTLEARVLEVALGLLFVYSILIIPTVIGLALNYREIQHLKQDRVYQKLDEANHELIFEQIRGHLGGLNDLFERAQTEFVPTEEVTVDFNAHPEWTYNQGNHIPFSTYQPLTERQIDHCMNCIKFTPDRYKIRWVNDYSLLYAGICQAHRKAELDVLVPDHI